MGVRDKKIGRYVPAGIVKPPIHSGTFALPADIERYPYRKRNQIVYECIPVVNQVMNYRINKEIWQKPEMLPAEVALWIHCVRIVEDLKTERIIFNKSKKVCD